MYKIVVALTLSTLMASSAFAAGGLNSAIGGQSENAQTDHATGDASSKADAGSSYVKLHHRHAHTIDKQ